MNYKKSICIIGHGSNVKSANLDFINFVNIFKKLNKNYFVNFAFLEKSKPSPQSAIDVCAKKSYNVIIIPLLLFDAGHSKNDIPKIINEVKIKFPNHNFYTTEAIGFNLEIIDSIINKLNVIYEKNKNITDFELIILSRGFKDKAAFKEFIKVIQKIKKSLNPNIKNINNKINLAYSGFQNPDLKKCLENIFKNSNYEIEKNKNFFTNFFSLKDLINILNNKTINKSKVNKKFIIIPYFLFKGTLINRAKTILKEFYKKNRNFNFEIIEPLIFTKNDKFLLSEILTKRINNLFNLK